MATAPGIKGNPLYANSDDMAGPAQISAVSVWAADHIGEEADTVSALPSTGNWAGRHVYVTSVGDHVWDGTEWLLIAGGDTGWQAVTLASGMSVQGSVTPGFRIRDKHVVGRGLIKKTSGTFSTGQATVGTLPTPSQFGPPEEWKYLPTNADAVSMGVRLIVHSDGPIVADFESSGASWVSLASATWLQA